MLDLLAPDAEQAHGDELRLLFEHLDQVETLIQGTESALNARIRAAVGVGERQLLDLAQQWPAIVEVAGEPLSLLAAAREALSADRRTVAMLPTPPRVRVVEAPEDRERLPDMLPDPTKAERQLVLPSLNPHPSPRVGPAPWLTVFDTLGGVSMMPGRGAPLDLRLFVEALAWAPPAARAGRMVDVPLTVRELAEALWPHGRQRGRDLPKLRNAMRAINALGWTIAPSCRFSCPPPPARAPAPASIGRQRAAWALAPDRSFARTSGWSMNGIELRWAMRAWQESFPRGFR